MATRFSESFADDAARESEGVAAKVAAGCSSFSADTEVMTAGGKKPIAEIEVGDLVLAWDEESNTQGYFIVSDEIAHLDPQIHFHRREKFSLSMTDSPRFHSKIH